MRPNITENLQAIRRVFADVILPDLASDFARVRATAVLAALKDIERHWDSVLPNLMEENDDLAKLLQDAAGLEDALGAPLAQELAAIVGEPLPKAAYPSLAELTARNKRYRQALAQLIPALDLAMADVSATAIGPLRERIRQYLRKYLDRDF